MNTHKIYLSALTAILLLPACSKVDNAGSAPETGIRFSSPLQTKATDAVATTDVFQVRDWYNESSYHIENTIRWDNGTSKWVYGTAGTYKWTGGSHLLFGWLDHDDSYSTTAFFGTGLSAQGDSLVLPSKVLTTSTAQYDFLYSNPVYRLTADNDYTDVPLIFNHLFARWPSPSRYRMTPRTENSPSPCTACI